MNKDISERYPRLPIHALNLRRRTSSDGVELDKLAYLLGGNDFNQYPKVKENSWLQLFLPRTHVPQSSGHLPSASINDRGPYGFWLAVAEFCGRQDVIEILMKHSTSMNESPNNHEPLQFAARQKYTPFEQEPPRTDADVKLSGIYGGTALHHGCLVGNSKFIEALLNAGADPTVRNQFGRTCIETAARFGNEEIWKAAVARHVESQKTKKRQERDRRQRRQRIPFLAGGELEALFDVSSTDIDEQMNADKLKREDAYAGGEDKVNNDKVDKLSAHQSEPRMTPCGQNTADSVLFGPRTRSGAISFNLLLALCVMSTAFLLFLRIIAKEGGEGESSKDLSRLVNRSLRSLI